MSDWDHQPFFVSRVPAVGSYGADFIEYVSTHGCFRIAVMRRHTGTHPGAGDRRMAVEIFVEGVGWALQMGCPPSDFCDLRDTVTDIERFLRDFEQVSGGTR